MLGALQRGRQSRVARARREGGDQHAADLSEEGQRLPISPQAQPERHRTEEMEEHDRQAPEGEDAEGDQDVQPDLDDDAVDHQRHGIRREPQGELHDAGHEFGDQIQR